MEFWTGWFDHWGERHGGFPLPGFQFSLKDILTNQASVNFYMFHGGTNFGFMNGANALPTFPHYKPDITSYDYDAPVSEHGTLTAKWNMTRKMMEEFAGENPHLRHCFQFVDPPPEITTRSYGSVKISKMLELNLLLAMVDDAFKSQTPVQMEMASRKGSGTGQNFGFILYRKQVAQVTEVKFDGFVADRATILLNGKEVETVDFTMKDAQVRVDALGEFNTLDILVENLGRVNYGRKMEDQRKGLKPGQVTLDSEPLEGVTVYCLDFGPEFLQKAVTHGSWKDYDIPDHQAPGLYRADLEITDHPADTFLHLEPFDWHHGIAFVNGFNLGRYWQIGPQKTLYIPAPLLVQGHNEILIFEIHRPHSTIDFRAKPVLS